jgi:hypothetical protein
MHCTSSLNNKLVVTISKTVKSFLASSVAAISVLSLTAPVHAETADEVYQNTNLALALHDRCDLFTDQEKLSLDQGSLQSRGILLRTGFTIERLDRFVTDIVTEAQSISCEDEQTLTIQANIIDAFAAFKMVPSMSFEADYFSWEVNRMSLLSDTSWIAVQTTNDLRAGIAVVEGEFGFYVAPISTGSFSAAILVLRDMSREPSLYDASVGGLFNATPEAPWAAWTPPDHARNLIWASGKLRGTLVEPLTGSLANDVFNFPLSAAIAIAERDPRETARIDFMDVSGNRVGSRYIEIGDFAAALAFLKAVIPEGVALEM